MRSFFTIVIFLLIFIWMVSKCGGSGSETAYSETSPTETEQKFDTSPEATRARILAAEREKAETEALRKQEIVDEKKFLKSKAGRIWKKHPEWSKEDCELLASNKIWIGMAYSMLKYKRGLPDHANPSNYGNGTQWQWCWNDYTPSCFYDHDDDGKIDSYN